MIFSTKEGRLRVIFGSWIGVAGVIVLSFSFLVGAALLMFDISGGFKSPYAGLVVYMAIPAFLLLGIGMIILGAWLTIRKRKKIGHDTPLPSVDLNDPVVLRHFIIFSVLLMVFIVVSGMGGYHAYHYTESVEFCGKVCHKVMKPEYVAFTHSPHANVTCAHCHIGPGAEWFVKAKLSGLYQVYSVMFDKYHRPIETPVHNLRPARETCNECHWPQKFFGAVLRSWTYYLPDEQNSPWTIKMLLKVGGGDTTHGPGHGIHWHMSKENTIDYVSKDDKRIEIPWVAVTDKDGNKTIYRFEDSDVSKEDIAEMAQRRMDCLDCHNRPTHQIRSPNKAMDQAMLLGLVDKAIPEVRVNAIELLVGEYKTEEEAFKAIDEGLRENYKDHAGIDSLVAEVQKIYARNFFPEMKVDWKAYPDHIGHKITTGCFRCHDDRHVSEDGRKIRRDCNLCHTIIAQGPGEANDVQQISSGGLEFKHPEDIDKEWKTEDCASCHEGIPM